MKNTDEYTVKKSKAEYEVELAEDGFRLAHSDEAGFYDSYYDRNGVQVATWVTELGD